MCDECEDVVGKAVDAAQAAHEYPRAVRARLHADAQALGEQKARTDRALAILERHPEFEELLELISLVGTPIQVPRTFPCHPLVART
jgi:hypothetical protein